MLKINDNSQAKLPDASFYNKALTSEAGKTFRNKKNERPKKSFSAFLKRQTPEAAGQPYLTESAGLSTTDILPALLDDIHEAGDALSKHPFPDEIKRYRSTIRQFLRYILDTAFDVKEDTGIPNNMKAGFDAARYKRDPELRKARNKYSTVQIIDQKLDQLAAGVIIGQLKQIQLLESIEEIHGLLVDLLE
ncbi:MAG: YaaR family protein [Spirochaetaceae bacterium]|jgi:uncharacterized protein YaaR (DUF327 family)|nr:YaaR family protein [Spirochaetaceae bacterium]